MTRADKLALRILDDRAKPHPVVWIGGCFMCGRSYQPPRRVGDASPRFCGEMCREAYDGGLSPTADLNPFTVPQWVHAAGPSPGRMPVTMRQSGGGWLIECRHCGREFASRGLRCCSIECERGLKTKAETIAILAEVGDVPTAKRECECCGGPIPNWIGEGIKRRRTPISRKYCSDRCRWRTNKTGGILTPERAKTPEPSREAIPPLFGPRMPPRNVLGGYRFPGAPEVDLDV